MTQTPSICRTVHYVEPSHDEYASVCRAAIITEVHTELDAVGLCVLSPNGMFFLHGVPYADAEQRQRDTWHWPEQVPPR